MIQVIRYGVFETNSSSSHSFSLVSKQEAESDLRDVKSEEDLEEEAQEYAEENEVDIEEARYEEWLEQMRETTNYISSCHQKLSFCESLILRFGQYDNTFDARVYLKKIKEKLYDERALDNYLFAIDGKRSLVLIEDEEYDDALLDFESYFLSFAKDMLGDYKNIETTCERIKNIVTDDEIYIKIHSNTDLF